jgi:hypothetical protein
MRAVLAMGLLIALCTSADAATVHRSYSTRPIVHPNRGVTAPQGVTAPPNTTPGIPGLDPGRGWSHAG